MSQEKPRPYTRSESVEIALGAILVVGALATWSPRIALTAAGILLLVTGIWGRRIF